MSHSLITMGDGSLYDRLRHGDADAFTELYGQFGRRIFSYASRLLKDPAAAEDVVQETMAKVYSSLPELADKEALRGWIFTVARNQVFGELRRTRAVRLEDEDEVWDECTPLDSLVSAEETEIVRRLLEELKPEYREALILREFEGCSYAEIAGITSSTVCAVKSRIFKARKGLLKRIQKQYAEKE